MTLMDESGNVLRSRTMTHLRSEVEEFLEGVKDCHAVIEAGRSSCTRVDLLDELGVKVTMSLTTFTRPKTSSRYRPGASVGSAWK